ncbi:MAG: DUF2207 domain-containing protein [Bacilli bacterium]|nr:DUF2207 domain-containing protein [Bacilli bacterium]MBO5414161.1 DUF2207 domain-containing protein [Bacilli bacterium]
MDKVAKIIRISIILIVLAAFLPDIIYSFSGEEAINNPYDYARITDVDYKAELVDEPGDGGKVIITERLTFDIHAASKNNLFWELWRDLPEDYVDGLKVDYKVNSVKQIYEDGTEVTYEESPKLYWEDEDYTSYIYGPEKWYHSEGPYDEDAAQYECVFFYVDGLYREKVVFEIEYEMNNAALRYNDISELYLSMYSEETIKYLESFKGQILIPDSDMPSSGNYEAHTYGTNSHTFDFTESDTLNPGYHTFSFELDKADLKFKPYNQYIEFSLWSYGDDSHIFTDYAPNNDYSNDDALEELRLEQMKYEKLPETYKYNKIIVLIVSIFISIVIIISTFGTNKKLRKKHIFYSPSMTMEFFREIPSDLDPYFVSKFVFCRNKTKKDDTNGYSAVMLSLVRKDYIELAKIDYEKDWTTNNIKIIVKYKPTPIQPVTQTTESLEVQPQEIITPSYPKLEPLTTTEELYFNLIVRHATNDEISMNSFQSKVSSDYENTDSFVRNIEKSIVNVGVSQGYFQKANYEQPKNEIKSTATAYTILGILCLVIINFISYRTRLDLAHGAFFILGITLLTCAIYLNKIANKYILLTQFGEDEYAKWKALYNFLNSETLMNERTVIELPVWEQYLVYATAFGISEKVVKALEIRCPSVETSTMLSNPYYRSNNFRVSSRSFSSATRSASYTSRSSSFGGGSYYGGGGRGGGGGGGGH